MSDLVKRVAEAINSYDPSLVEARAAIAVVLKEQKEDALRLHEKYKNQHSRYGLDFIAWLESYARENGVSLDD